MNYFIAAFGQQSQEALKQATTALQANTKWQHCTLVPTHDHTSLTAAYLQSGASEALEPIIPYGEALIIQSRKSKIAFIQSNRDFLQSINNSQTPAPNMAVALSSQLCSANALKTLKALEGDFTLLAVNQLDQNVTLAVSAFNPQTLFYIALPGFAHTYVVSTNIELLLAITPSKVNPSALALWLSGRPNPNMSMYANIHQMVPGTCEVFSANGDISCERFWDINPHYSLANEPAQHLASQLTEHISNSVKMHLAGTEPQQAVFCQMSGGMDSTSVTAMVHKALNENSTNSADNAGSARLHTVSHTYKNTESCDESDNIQAMIKRYNITNSHFIELDKYTNMSFAELYPTHAQSPGMVLSPKYFEEAALLQQHGAKLLLTGNGGDEMFWGHSLAYYDRVKKGDTSVITEVIKGAKALNLPVIQTLRSVFVRPFIKYDLMPFLHLADRYAQMKAGTALPPWLSPLAKQLIDDENHSVHNVFAIKGAELSKYARYEGVFSTSTVNSMRSYQAVFDQFGLTVEHPLFNTSIAEFSFAVPQHMHISGKYPKLLLRQAMNNYLPEQVCWDDQKTVFDQHFAKLVSQNAQSLRLLLQHPALADLGLVNNKVLLAEFDQLLASKKPSLNVDLLYTILVQSWYQTHVEQ